MKQVVGATEGLALFGVRRRGFLFLLQHALANPFPEALLGFARVLLHLHQVLPLLGPQDLPDVQKHQGPRLLQFGPRGIGG